MARTSTPVSSTPTGAVTTNTGPPRPPVKLWPRWPSAPALAPALAPPPCPAAVGPPRPCCVENQPWSYAYQPAAAISTTTSERTICLTRDMRDRRLALRRSEINAGNSAFRREYTRFSEIDLGFVPNALFGLQDRRGRRTALAPCRGPRYDRASSRGAPYSADARPRSAPIIQFRTRRQSVSRIGVPCSPLTKRSKRIG